MKKQIRFMRPNPQSYINDIFLHGAQSERTMMIIVDGYFRGHPDHIPPHREIPKLLIDGMAAEKKGIEIFKTIMKQLQITNWKFRIPSDIGMNSFVEIMKKYTKKPIKETKHKLMIEKTRSLLVFASRNGPNEFGLEAIKEYLKYGKQVCVVDQYGIKRYPRERNHYDNKT